MLENCKLDPESRTGYKGCMFLDMPLEEAMRTQIAMRRLKPDPVDDELLLHLTDLAIRAPSGKNQQKWDFIFLKDREKVAQVGRLNGTVVNLVKPFLREDNPMRRGFVYQAEHFDEIPVVCVPCVKGYFFPAPLIHTASLFGSIFPAVQNLLLAARAAGLGTTLITVPLWNTFKLRKIIGAPWGLLPVCVIPMGWPARKFVPNKRLPAEQSFHIDSYRG